MLPMAITGIHRLEQNSITQLVYENNLRLVTITINNKHAIYIGDNIKLINYLGKY